MQSTSASYDSTVAKTLGLFLVTGLLIKKVKDNKEMVDRILEKHFPLSNKALDFEKGDEDGQVIVDSSFYISKL